MSPSPISSGASSPLTSGGGSIPFRHINQSVYLHEISKSTHNLYAHNVPDIFRAKQPTQERPPVLADSIKPIKKQSKFQTIF